MGKLLEEKYNIPVEYHEFHPTTLLQFVKDEESRIHLPKLMKYLESKKIHSIGALLKLSESDILRIREVGIKTTDFLLELLERATTLPLEQEKEKPQQDQVNRLIQRYLEKVVKNQ